MGVGKVHGEMEGRAIKWALELGICVFMTTLGVAPTQTRPQNWCLKKKTGTTNGSFENEALENEDRSTKHPNLEKEAP